MVNILRIKYMMDSCGKSSPKGREAIRAIPPFDDHCRYVNALSIAE